MQSEHQLCIYVIMTQEANSFYKIKVIIIIMTIIIIITTTTTTTTIIIIIIIIIIGSLMLSRCYAPTFDHPQPAELCMRGCGYTMTLDFT